MDLGRVESGRNWQHSPQCGKTFQRGQDSSRVLPLWLSVENYYLTAVLSPWGTGTVSGP